MSCPYSQVVTSEMLLGANGYLTHSNFETSTSLKYSEIFFFFFQMPSLFINCNAQQEVVVLILIVTLCDMPSALSLEGEKDHEG